MRFGFGKKVGGVYVGTSISGNSLAKGIYWFFAWPFYLAYYMLVWPFIKLYQYNKKKKSRAFETTPKTVEVDGTTFEMMPAEARPVIEGLKKSFEDNLNLVQSTKNPDVFFERLAQAESVLKRLIASYEVCEIENNARDVLKAFQAKKESRVNDFIERYAKEVRRKIYDLSTEKAKNNKAEAFRKILLEFSDRLTDNNREFIDSEYSELKELAK